jgi:hypothetical protein
LHNHALDIAAMDLFVVPTIGFDLLYAFVIVRLGRRDLVWTNVTAYPTAIGSIRRECVDHIIILGEAHLRRILKGSRLRLPTPPARPQARCHV